jgi:peptidoglycan hydrolase-like protein with peptidoglycan-binding domain
MRSSFAHALRLILVGAIAIAVPGAASAGLICTYRDHAANIVRRVQEKLSDQYGPLTADGSIGPATRKALRAFQEKNGLKVSGELDQVTFHALFGAKTPYPERIEVRRPCE